MFVARSDNALEKGLCRMPDFKKAASAKSKSAAAKSAAAKSAAGKSPSPASKSPPKAAAGKPKKAIAIDPGFAEAWNAKKKGDHRAGGNSVNMNVPDGEYAGVCVKAKLSASKDNTLKIDTMYVLKGDEVDGEQVKGFDFLKDDEAVVRFMSRCQNHGLDTDVEPTVEGIQSLVDQLVDEDKLLNLKVSNWGDEEKQIGRAHV